MFVVFVNNISYVIAEKKTNKKHYSWEFNV